jgi:hypothetical protein
MRPRGLFAEGAAAGEILAWAASHTRQHRSGSPSIDRLVQEVPASGRARPGEMAQRYGAETAVPDWRQRLVCSRWGGREVDMVVTGEWR